MNWSRRLWHRLLLSIWLFYDTTLNCLKCVLCIFKSEHDAAELRDNQFREGIANKQIVQWWFQKNHLNDNNIQSKTRTPINSGTIRLLSGSLKFLLWQFRLLAMIRKMAGEIEQMNFRWIDQNPKQHRFEVC